MPEVLHLLKIKSSPERVYQAITTAEGIAHWWTRDATIGAEVGARGEFGFYERRFVMNLHVTELVPPIHVGWHLESPPSAGMTIAFDIRPADDGTVLAFAQRGYKETDDNFARVNTRWGYYLISLKNYLELGAGTPNPDDTDF